MAVLERDIFAEATIEELYHVPGKGKAEIVDGRIVYMAPTGDEPNRASFFVAMNLSRYEELTDSGRVYTDNAGFVVNLPRRKSFSPDASFYVGPRTGKRFLNGAPLFAVEIRSENDYGPAAERKMATKRADYFVAGTKVVWDVDLDSEDTVRKYTSDATETPTIFRRGEMADVEPALPGWTMPVNDLFR